ncbi:glycosyltransferase family 2 protein [Paenibacillus daejeonensis]|uniref:glycosyltransferase family 2 protein n=1 Tax=Paenibacillus daejeonensis TaxID=135193 RepID=UPI0003737557|nr:glycosyltransferase family 2 protein [Paenibacillus daejeonensis]
MRIFLLNAQQAHTSPAAAVCRSSTEPIDVVALGPNPAQRLNAELAGLKDPFFIILRETDWFTEDLLIFLSGWIAEASPETPGLALIPVNGTGEPLPVVWRTSSARIAGFTPPPTLPWPELVLTDAYERMGGAHRWTTMPFPKLKLRRSMVAGAHNKRIDRLRPLLRQTPPWTGEFITPQISIVLCTYNDCEVLPLALRSVMAQESNQWELIIVDDGSEDATAAVVAPYLEDRRIQLIRHEDNSGKSRALNSALRYVRAPWLLELDADDWLASNAVSGLLHHAEAASEETALIYGTYEEWREQPDGLLRYAGSRSPAPSQAQLLGSGYPVAPRLYSTRLLRQLGGWPADDPEQGRLFEDFRMLLRLSTHYRFINSRLNCYHRRVRRSSITARHTSRFADWAAWITSNDL